jgi:hypothetical protein
VRVHDNDDGGGAAEPRIRVDTMDALSQEQNWSKISRVSGVRGLEATCQCVLVVDATYLPVAYCTASCRHSLRPPHNLLLVTLTDYHNVTCFIHELDQCVILTSLRVSLSDSEWVVSCFLSPAGSP